MRQLLGALQLSHVALSFPHTYAYVDTSVRLLQAFGAVESMSDRYCISFAEQVNISAQDLNSCCRSCGQG